MVIIRCPIKPAVEVVYQEFPKFAAAEPTGFSTLFLLISFIVLLGAVVLSLMYLMSIRR